MKNISSSENQKQTRLPILIFQNDVAQWHTIRSAMQQCFPEVEPIWMTMLTTVSVYLDTVSAISHAIPRLIFIDFSVSSQADGLAFLIQLKADPRFEKIPVIILNDTDTPEDVLMAYALGASGYVLKPLLLTDWLICLTSFKSIWWKLAKLPLSA